MSRMTTLTVSAVLLVFFAVQAEALEILGKITSVLSGEVISFALSAVLAIGAGILGFLFTRVSRTLKEVGDFLTVLGDAMEDRKITREELAGIVKEGKEIFGVWK
jgi:Mg2+/Co2+ transporter CorB